MLIQGSVAVLLSLLHNVSAQTLYTVSAPGTIFDPWANATISVTEIGTGADGGTTYVEVATAIPSVIVTQEIYGITYSTPETINVEPFTNTFVEDATGYRVSGVDILGSYAETCTFGPDGRGACVGSQALTLESSTDVFTISGSVHPFYTLTAASVISPTSSSISSTPSPTAPPNAAVPNSISSSYLVLFMSFVLGIFCSL